jgi:digeranylgeranylglycerophospholipid reductase
MIKIAIMGAGLAGLSCAHELEKYGLNPVIFEDLNFIGDREAHMVATISVADRPMKNVLEYFKETCHLDLKPVDKIKKITHYSPNKKMVVKGGKLGYFFRRGKEYNSIKGQIYSQLSNTEIMYSQKPDYKQLATEYDYVVVANGLPIITKELGCWSDLISGWIMAATIEGDFDTNELVMWINHKCCKNGYAYLCPYDANKATLALFVPLVNLKIIEYYWKQFLSIASVKISFKIVEEWAVEHFSGYVSPHKIGNIFFAGAAGGAVSPLLGFGSINSISMGVFAAQAIVEGLDYEKLLKPILDKEMAFSQIRKFFDSLNDKGFDSMLKIMGFPGIKQLIYHSNVNVIKHFGNTLKLKDMLVKKK